MARRVKEVWGGDPGFSEVNGVNSGGSLAPRRRGQGAPGTHRADLQRQGALQRLHLRHPRGDGRRGGTPAAGPSEARRRRAGRGRGGDGGGGGSCGPQAGARGPAWVPPEKRLCAGRRLVVMASGRGVAAGRRGGDAPEPPRQGGRLGAGLGRLGGDARGAGLQRGSVRSRPLL